MRFVTLSAILPALSQAAKYAVIAAGSSGYMNYRHQADACHAYQVMKKSGIPEENIIMMMQDDVATSRENPFPGQLFNKPGNDVDDVYAGCKVDYRGKDVTAKLFLSVITGDTSNTSGVPANGKVLKSGPNDHVFLNFVDHGGVGIIAFPNGPVLHAIELSNAIKTMQESQMFQQLVFYMEACESGSMFPKLQRDGKVLAVTAANAKESSWGTYCGSAAKVNGKSLGTCLGDLFSVSWMEDSDLGYLGAETLKTQIQRVTQRTNKSHVESFGDSSFEDEPIGDFQHKLQGTSRLPTISEANSVDVRDLDVHQAYEAWSLAKTAEEKAQAWKHLMQVVADRTEDEAIFKGFVVKACSDVDIYKCQEKFETAKEKLKDLDCHAQLVQTVFEECPRRETHFSPGGWNGFNMQFSQVLANVCEGKRALGKSNKHLDGIIRTECATARLRTETAGIVV